MDLNGDGYLDILSGSWPGELFLFKGGKDNTFAAPEMITDRHGKIINIGGGIRERPDGGILITGNAEFENTPEGIFVTYHGKRLESTPEKPIAITGTASAVHASDWDGDGDYDLLVGDIRGNVYLVPNEGTSTSYAFGRERHLQADGKPIKVGGNAGPFVADWDDDGDHDLLIGCDDGSVLLFSNTGSSKLPALAAPTQLVPPGAVSNRQNAPKEVRRGGRSKICVADWNGDGRLDLLVGDFTKQKPDLPELTPEEKATEAKIRAELESVTRKWSLVIERLHGPERVREEEERERLRKKLEEIRETMADLRSKLRPEYEDHGWVWLFLRKDKPW